MRVSIYSGRVTTTHLWLCFLATPGREHLISSHGFRITLCCGTSHHSRPTPRIEERLWRGGGYRGCHRSVRLLVGLLSIGGVLGRARSRLAKVPGPGTAVRHDALESRGRTDTSVHYNQILESFSTWRKRGRRFVW